MPPRAAGEARGTGFALGKDDRHALRAFAAQELARQIAAFPQQCMLTDRRSAYEQWDMPLAEALRREGALGVPVVFAEGQAGAARFAGGAGRHGEFGS